jgi:hypothetical protein
VLKGSSNIVELAQQDNIFRSCRFSFFRFVFTSRKINFNKLYTGIIKILQYKYVLIFVNIKIWNVTVIYI